MICRSALIDLSSELKCKSREMCTRRIMVPVLCIILTTRFGIGLGINLVDKEHTSSQNALLTRPDLDTVEVFLDSLAQCTVRFVGT